MEQDNNSTKQSILLELNINDSSHFTSSISSALMQSDIELQTLQDTIDSIHALKPDCDKIDYTLAACSGVLCGIIDVFLVGKPGESPLGNLTDKWFSNRVQDFAKLYGWKGGNEKSAIGFLERRFKIPYDQRGVGDAGSTIFDLTPSNHHFKSLAHNPSLLGLFFSILDQFTNQTHFVSDGRLISLQEADGKFELKGGNIPSKLFCGFFNWFGHIMSDISGSSGGKGRGMGIPSPLWTWMNDIIAIKSKLGIPVSEFDKSFNELAIEIFNNGYDFRFQTTQIIPVLLNELIVRVFYATRRLIRYFNNTPKEEKLWKSAWQSCKPFSNQTIRRMLTVAHGSFCVIDIGDATIRGFATGGGAFNPVEFFLRINIVGVGRFTISLFGEAKDAIKFMQAKREAVFAQRKKYIVEDYIEGLKILADTYDDRELITFIDDLKNNNYIEGFNKSVQLAQKRGAPAVTNKEQIDAYFKNIVI